MTKTAKRRRGDLGEGIACRFLIQKGFEILERNYLKPWGEIDIVALKDGVVRFIEVKTVTREIVAGSSSELDYRPEEMVTREKLERVVRTAMAYMDSKNDPREYQVDVVGVVADPSQKVARCRLFEQVL